MSLTALRPSVPTDLVELSSHLHDGGTSRTAMPASLPDALLLSVARDLRSIEEMSEYDQVSVSAPVILAISILSTGQGASSTAKHVSISDEDLYASLRVYQWAVEREIVTRLTGLGGDSDEDILRKFLRAASKHSTVS